LLQSGAPAFPARRFVSEQVTTLGLLVPSSDTRTITQPFT
jgi:hypothetical protein